MANSLMVLASLATAAAAVVVVRTAYRAHRRSSMHAAPAGQADNGERPTIILAVGQPGHGKSAILNRIMQAPQQERAGLGEGGKFVEFVLGMPDVPVRRNADNVVRLSSVAGVQPTGIKVVHGHWRGDVSRPITLCEVQWDVPWQLPEELVGTDFVVLWTANCFNNRIDRNSLAKLEQHFHPSQIIRVATFADRTAEAVWQRFKEALLAEKQVGFAASMPIVYAGIDNPDEAGWEEFYQLVQSRRQLKRTPTWILTRCLELVHLW